MAKQSVTSDLSSLRQRIRDTHLTPEGECIDTLLTQAEPLDAMQPAIERRAVPWVNTLRSGAGDEGFSATLLQEYGLGTEEGVVLMCLAEALLRIPDADTADQLIRDRLSAADWAGHIGHSDSWLVNASTFGLLLSGRLERFGLADDTDPGTALKRLVSSVGEPVVRAALLRAVRYLGQQFVMGEDLPQALARADAGEYAGYALSFDMLGEAALTAAEAEGYFDAYAEAIRQVRESGITDAQGEKPGVSVKLSALHPRYESTQRERLQTELVPRVVELAALAREAGVPITLDAEESQRLEPMLDVFAAVAAADEVRGYDFLGLALQAYQKRAPAVIDWLAALAGDLDSRFRVRLVKGAYWDTEIKRAQMLGLADYPVYTRKAATDLAYLLAAQRLLELRGKLYPQFATHNAHTIAALLELAPDTDFEFQRLHGMGRGLYDQVIDTLDAPPRCRIYAPVGAHRVLLPYLVRRLLENGANTSFIHHVGDHAVPVERLLESPRARLHAPRVRQLPLPRPPEVHAERRAARGLDVADPVALEALQADIARAAAEDWRAAPCVAGDWSDGEAQPVENPARSDQPAGTVVPATLEDVERAAALAQSGFADWNARPPQQRAECLLRLADAYESRFGALVHLCVNEAGKTLADAVADVREAIDFCRYYAHRAQLDLGLQQSLAIPTGERNDYGLGGRGLFVCISPWNFPLAIFTGQVAAALVAGNAVLAKPAPQTPLVAAEAVRLMLEAGVPPQVLHLLPGGADIGEALVSLPDLAGVAFTGSHATARAIYRTLADHSGALPQFIAETGGINAMVVDSSALPDQVVSDVLRSAWQSAGQRCSALRLLCLQEEIADAVLDKLCGAAFELRVGDPARIDTDIGPIIDRPALERLHEHAKRLAGRSRRLLELGLSDDCGGGHYFAPQAFLLDDLGALTQEVFGPVLHVVRYRRRDLESLLKKIDGYGFGLTLGVHSRIEQRAAWVAARVRAGNVYINRDMIGAAVGTQPFGGLGLSGTGPKAGGPHYLPRFAAERTLSVNTAAIGGNAVLLARED